MTAPGHRITAFFFLGAVSNSLLAAVCGALGSVFPDTVEYLIWGSGKNKYHRKFSHWIVLWGCGFYLSFYRGAGGCIPFMGTVLTLNLNSALLWGCAAFWFLGGAFHIFCDACCGKVPLLITWKRNFGAYVFKMSPKRGEMSGGEIVFTAFISLTSLVAWLLRAKNL